jgi:methionyl aminopeptidase
MAIIVKSAQEIALMRRAGRITAEVLDIMAKSVRPGMKTSDMDAIAVRELKRLGGTSSFKGYHGYPATVCTSVNDEIVHGIPGKRVLNEGDIVSLDFGVIYMGWQGDSAVTVGVGKISDQARKLMEATEGSLMAGIAAAVDGARLGDVSAAIQNYAEGKGYAVIREYTGHGIGQEMHEDPLIPNFGVPGTGPALKKGMVLAIEPMLTDGDWHTRVGKDNWTVYTMSGKNAAHFEHTIAITDGAPEILTVKEGVHA